MGIENYITDPQNHKKAQVDSPPGEKQSLIVSTRELKEFANLTTFFVNPNFGINLNVNASFSSSDPSGGEFDVITEEVYNADDLFWSPSIISGGDWQATSADQNHTTGGTFSLKYDNGDAGNVFQILNDTGDFNLTNYLVLVFYTYIDKNYDAGDSISIYGYDIDMDSQIGDKAFIEDYITIGDTGVWQKVSIPLSLMGLTGQIVDAFRIEIEATDGKGTKIYIDDMELEGLEEAGTRFGPQIYTVQPPPNQWWHITEITSTIASPTDINPNTLEDATLPYLEYHTFMGLTLEAGLTYQRIINDQIAFSFTTLSLGDTLALPNTTIEQWGDEHSTFSRTRILFTEPLVLKGEDIDFLRIILADDYSDLLQYRTSVGGKIETRKNPQTPKDITVVNRALR